MELLCDEWGANQVVVRGDHDTEDVLVVILRLRHVILVCCGLQVDAPRHRHAPAARQACLLACSLLPPG